LLSTKIYNSKNKKNSENRIDDIDKSIAHIEFSQFCFKEVNCNFGTAECLFALGVLKYAKKEYGMSRQKLKDA